MHHARHISPTTRRTAGFTIVEILVVVSIFTLLLTILLPAINNAREGARRGICNANQIRLCNAMGKFNAFQGSLPGWRNRVPLNPGVMNGTNNFRDASWAVMLLPYLERNDVFNGLKNNRLWQDTNGSASIQLAEFLCPSGGSAAQASSYSVLHYGVNTATTASRYNGVLTDPVGTTISQSLEDVRNGDGLKHTYLLVDAFFSDCSWGGGGQANWGSSPGASPNARNLSLTLSGWQHADIHPVINRPANNFRTYLPRSRHPGGVNAIFCDGSVKFLKDGLPSYLWAHLATSRSVWRDNTMGNPTNTYNPINSASISQYWLRNSIDAPPVAQEPVNLDLIAY